MNIHTAAQSLLAFCFGHPDAWLKALVAFIILNVITTILQDIQHSFFTVLSILFKKTFYIAVVAVSTITDNITEASGFLRIAAIAALVTTEGLTILNNCAEAGVPIPQKLKEALAKLKERDKE